MPRKKLHETIETLHAQLQADKPLDEADKAHLTQILHDIEKTLDADEPDEGFGDRINEAITEFETSHPAIAAGFNELVRLLKRL